MLIHLTLHLGPYRYGSSCYVIMLDIQSWGNSRDDCANSGFELVSIETEVEQQYLVELLEDLLGTVNFSL